VAVEEYLRPQRRYAHLFGEDGHPEILERLQGLADANIREYGLLPDGAGIDASDIHHTGVGSNSEAGARP
jgi:hypothetical protein